ncbi:RNase adaptor protein RapZ [Salinivibrio sp. PR5]|uniref:RNase adapter RapZ n=1 Tax=Salinivibrio sp. PR5 TaxID=1909484 RepID=UPI00098AAA2E|nr:RNase adapter RapZ [Salinivibrio sp. PR5]OOF12476.1 RNase adaptor protein RapZ [Salinivibrio sp. PR5]
MMLKIVSGRSGSGKSVALQVLEDLGYYCVDNLPVNLLRDFVTSQEDAEAKIAVSLDIRNLPNANEPIADTLAALREVCDVTLYYLDADDKDLIKRFSETRRLHPLSRQNLSLEQAIQAEKQQMAPIKEHADRVINTTGLSIHDLSESVRSLVLGRASGDLVMVFESFGFKHGLPADADYVFDVRFLPNPHWEPTLRPHTGLEKPVRMFLAAQPDVAMVIAQIKGFLESWLPALKNNNRSYVTVAIGCTGGKHRSVYIAQYLSDYFTELGEKVQIRHRTLEQSS